jgi:bla regulator protein BlaR1
MAAEVVSAFLPGALALGWTLLDFLWQGLLIACGYALARGLLRAPRQRLFAGHVTLLALAIAPLVSLLGHLQASAPPPAALQAAGGAVVSAMQATVQDTGMASESWLLWLVGAWFAGVSLLSLRLWREWRRLRRLCDSALPVAPEWQERFEVLARRLGVHVKVRLRQGAGIVTPMLVGVLRPTILLPASLVARLPGDQLELILVHELAHLRRLDPLFNLLQTGLDTLLFYHPAVHWISRKVREDRELCCDDIVVNSGGDRLRYARALLALAETQAHGLPLPALAAAGGALLERVERIVDLPAPRASNSQSLVAASLLGVLSLAWFVPREQQAALFEALPVALVPGAASLEPEARELAIGDIASAPLPLRVAMIEPAASDAAEVDPRERPVPEAAAVPVAREMQSETIAAAPQAGLARMPEPVAASTPTEAAEIAAPDAAPALAPQTHAQLQGHLDSAATVTPAAAVSAGPAPTRRVAPAYPRAARLRGVEGWVVLDYRVDGDGRVTDIAIREAQPEGAFELAARRALERWRYPAGAALAAPLTQRFDFVLAEEQRRGEDERCRRQTGSRVCRPAQEILLGSSVSLSVN